MSKEPFKSIGAVVAGFVLVFVLSILTDTTLAKIGVFPPQAQVYAAWMLGLALLYRCVYSVLGFYLCARLAPNNPLRHAIILGIIGTVFAAIGAAANWDKGAHWYPVALVVLTLPCAWLGGTLSVMKGNQKKQSAA